MTRLAARSGAAVAASGQLTALERPKMKETGRGGLQSQVMATAQQMGWDLRFHAYQSFHAAERGWPDFFGIRIRDRRMLIAELKDETRKVTDRQAEVLAMFEALTWPSPELEERIGSLFVAMPRIETHVWRPADWFDGTIEKVLR